ncbi:MAG: (2Fe-2S)-binding protein [Pirellulales bacterium]|nr:(2Fe-2S)-binding protein [Pirellulales bacterium]
MPTIYINGEAIKIASGERLNGIEAARRAGVEIPHYCWHPGLSVVASCRMCLVEVGTRNPRTGEVIMHPKLVPACQTPATDGTVFITNSEKVRAARARVEENLLINHPVDCPICDKAGECLLQDYHFQHGQESRRADIRPFHSRRRPLGETVMLFVDRCISCTRCVRFCREITGSNELMLTDRGSIQEIDVFPGYPLENNLAGNVVDLCPVGALADLKFLYQQRVWFMKSHQGVCTGCATGCSIFIDQNQDRIYRIRPRENMSVNTWWICDAGRYGWDYVHSKERLLEPRQLDADTQTHVPVDWAPLLNRLDNSLREAAKSGHLAAVLSPHCTVEEAYLAAGYVRSIDPGARIVLGPVPKVGVDQKFPNGFVIRAEKCPNRRGIEEIAAYFMRRDYPFEALLEEIGSDTITGAWVTGGYPEDWIDEPTAQLFSPLRLLVVQDLFDSPLMRRAHYQIPAAAFAERDGSYVNANHRLQYATWAIRPPAGVQVEGRLFWRLAGRAGLYQARTILREMAAEVPYFSAAKAEIPDSGIDLVH